MLWYHDSFLAFGCPQLKPRADHWFQHEGDNVLVSCNGTDDSWTLTCQGSMWVGEIGNCTPGEFQGTTGCFNHSHMTSTL